jgi:hypothetical protein
VLGMEDHHLCAWHYSEEEIVIAGRQVGMLCKMLARKGG